MANRDISKEELPESERPPEAPIAQPAESLEEVTQHLDREMASAAQPANFVEQHFAFLPEELQQQYLEVQSDMQVLQNDFRNEMNETMGEGEDWGTDFWGDIDTSVLEQELIEEETLTPKEQRNQILSSEMQKISGYDSIKTEFVDTLEAQKEQQRIEQIKEQPEGVRLTVSHGELQEPYEFHANQQHYRIAPDQLVGAGTYGSVYKAEFLGDSPEESEKSEHGYVAKVIDSFGIVPTDVVGEMQYFDAADINVQTMREMRKLLQVKDTEGVAQLQSIGMFDIDGNAVDNPEEATRFMLVMEDGGRDSVRLIDDVISAHEFETGEDTIDSEGIRSPEWFEQRKELIDEVFSGVEQATSGIENLHKRGLFHGDIKPQNLTERAVIDLAEQGGTLGYEDLALSIGVERSEINDIYSTAVSTYGLIRELFELEQLPSMFPGEIPRVGKDFNFQYYRNIVKKLRELDVFPEDFFSAIDIGDENMDAAQRMEYLKRIRPSARRVVKNIKEAFKNVSGRRLSQLQKQMRDLQNKEALLREFTEE